MKMPKFDASLDSGALTTLAGLGALAYFTRDKKDKDKPKEDKAAEALKEVAKPKENLNSGSSYTGPIGDATNDPVKAAPEAQDKSGFRGKAAGAKLTEPKFKPYPVKQAAQTKAAMAGTADPYGERAKQGEPPVVRNPEPAKTTTPAKPAAPVKSATPVKAKAPQGRAEFYADKRKKEEMRNNSLASQTVSKKQGGSVRSTASKRGDGIAKRGFTRA